MGLKTTLYQLKKFYTTPHEKRIIPETKKESIPKEWEELIDNNYIEYSNTVVVAINSGKEYYILTPTRK